MVPRSDHGTEKDLGNARRDIREGLTWRLLWLSEFWISNFQRNRFYSDVGGNPWTNAKAVSVCF